MGIFSPAKVGALVVIAVMVFFLFSRLGADVAQFSYAPAASTTAPATTSAAFPAASSTAPAGKKTTSTTPARPAQPLPPAQAPQAPKPALPQEELNALARASLVNILCTTKTGGSFNPISGSGVIVDSRGIILTNAHVAQYFLLRDYPTANNVECIVRTGSPAQPRYTAELLYLPPTWIAANADKIKSAEPTGTGENDYAFLRITGAAGAQVLPASFPALPMEAADIEVGDPMLLAAYPAGFLGGITIETSLYLSSAPATVGQLYTFGTPGQIDLFSLGGSIVSQAGSSGGAAVGGDGKLQGIIVTELLADTTSARDLRALSIAHVDRSLRAAGQGGITALLLQDAAEAAAQFNATLAPQETKALLDAIAK